MGIYNREVNKKNKSVLTQSPDRTVILIYVTFSSSYQTGLTQYSCIK